MTDSTTQRQDSIADDRPLADRVHHHPDCTCHDLSGDFPCFACFLAGRADLPVEEHSQRPRRHAGLPA